MIECREDKTMMDLGIISVAETTEYLRSLGMKISPDTLRSGLDQKVFPFGDCVYRTDGGSPRCYIYRRLLDQWISERVWEKRDDK